VKTFWNWHDRQLQDGTVIWTLPGGRTYVTTPGSALLFPALVAPTGELPTPPWRRDPATDAQRSARMPRRTTTRAQSRSHRITTERNHNRQIREHRDAEIAALLSPTGRLDEDVPPF
jgi:hypothetical protein